MKIKRMLSVILSLSLIFGSMSNVSASSQADEHEGSAVSQYSGNPGIEILEDTYGLFRRFSDGYKYEVYAKLKGTIGTIDERFIVYVKRFIPGKIVIETRTDKNIDDILEIIGQYDDFQDTDAIKIETSRDYEQTSDSRHTVTIIEKEADEKIINQKTAENIFNMFSEGNLINSMVLYRAGYMENECAWMPHIFYENQQEIIKQCIKDNNLDDIISLVKVNDNTATQKYALMMNKDLKSDSQDYEYDLTDICQIYYSDDACEYFKYFLKICYECKISPQFSRILEGVTVQEANRIYVREVTCGDVNFDKTIDMSDLTELSLMLLGDSKSDKYSNLAADIDDDNNITVADLARLKQYISKVAPSLKYTNNPVMLATVK